MSVNLAVVGKGAAAAAGKPADRGGDPGRAGPGFDQALADAGRNRHSGVGGKDPAAARRAPDEAGEADARKRPRDAGDASGIETEDIDAAVHAAALRLDPAEPTGEAERSADEDDGAGIAPAAAQDRDDAVPAPEAARRAMAMLDTLIAPPQRPERPAGAEGEAPAPERSPSAPRADARFGGWTLGIASAVSTLHMPVHSVRSLPAGDARQIVVPALPGAGGRTSPWAKAGEAEANAAQAGNRPQPAGQHPAAMQDGPRAAFQSIQAAVAGTAPPEGRTAGLQTVPGVPAPGGEGGQAPQTGTPSSAAAGAGSAESPRGSGDRIQFEPARGNTSANASKPDAAGTPDPLAGRVNVVAYSAALAPAPAPNPALGTTAAGLVGAFEADPTWRAAAAEAGLPAGQRGQAPAQPANTLRIQLRPAELGMVTARLTATGSQLSIEIQVESNDARHRLARDGDAIVTALRNIGFDVDRVTIQQAPPASAGTPQGGALARDPGFAEQQARGEQDARGRDGHARGGSEQEGARHGSTDTVAQRAGGGVYI